MVLPYRELPGAVSSKALEEHFKLYQGYWETMMRTREGFASISVPDKHYADHPTRAVKLAESYAISGVLLHEMYFKNLTDTPVPTQKGTLLKKAIEQRWGSIPAWWKEMRAAALGARGWAVLAACEVDPSELQVFMLDAHDVGSCFGYSPILVIDVYEHSYWGDWYTDRCGYLDSIVKYLNWNETEKRFTDAFIAAEARKLTP